jgi:hypothetical protein
MADLVIHLQDSDYERLKRAADRAGKSIQALMYGMILELSENDEEADVTKDPLYSMEGFDSDAPSDLSIDHDRYLYS